MSKRELSRVVSLRIVATPAARGAGRFEARLDGHDRVLCVSRTPFLTAARKLVAQGYDPGLTLILRHAGSDTDSLRAKLGTAASLTVKETEVRSPAPTLEALFYSPGPSKERAGRPGGYCPSPTHRAPGCRPLRRGK